MLIAQSETEPSFTKILIFTKAELQFIFSEMNNAGNWWEFTMDICLKRIKIVPQ